MRVVLLCFALLALASCKTLAPQPTGSWNERRAALQALDNYQINGQLAAATPTEGFSASMRWQQQGATSDLLLRAPLGVGGAHLNYDGEILRVTNSQGLQLEGAQAQAELVRLLGFDPPLTSLRYWLLGAPDPAAPAIESLDAAQRLAALEQRDWKISYADYQQSGVHWLPRHVELLHGPVKLKLQLSHWQLP